GEVGRAAAQRQGEGGLHGSGVHVSPDHGTARVAEHLIEEDALAATVAIAERVDQGQLGPVPGDGVGGGVAVRSAGQVGCDLVEDPVELVAQELRPGVGEAEGASVGGAKLSRPVVDVLEDVVVNRLEMGEVEAAIDGVELQFDDTAGGEKTFVVLEV